MGRSSGRGSFTIVSIVLVAVLATAGALIAVRVGTDGDNGSVAVSAPDVTPAQDADGCPAASFPAPATTPATAARGTIPPMPPGFEDEVEYDYPDVGPPDDFLMDRLMIGCDQIFGLAPDGIRAFDLDSGQPRWTSPVCSYPSWVEPTRQHVRSILLLRCDMLLMGLSTLDGTLLWSHTLAEAPEYMRSSDTSVALSYANSIELIDARTGRPAWTRQFGSGGHPLAVGNDMVAYTEGQRLLGLRTVDGTEAWSADINVGSLLVDGATLYIRGYMHNWYVLEMATGRTEWSTTEDDSSLIHSRIIGITRGHIVIQNDTAILGFDARTGKRTWAAPQGAGFADDGLVVATGESGYSVYDATTGKTLFSKTGVEYFGVPAVGRGRIALVVDGRLVTEDAPR